MGIFRRRLLPLFVGIVLIWLFLWYSHTLVSRLRVTRNRANETIAWFWAGTQVPLSSFAEASRIAVCSECGDAIAASWPYTGETVDRQCHIDGRITTWFVVTPPDSAERQQVFENTTALFRQLVKRLEYTTILSDTSLVPMVVNGEALPDSLRPEQMREYVSLIHELDSINDPIPIEEISGEVIGYLHYGNDDIDRELLLVPYIELGMLILLALLFLLVIRVEMKREKEMSWVSFAKETAHQISTPLSSLMGWMELLRERPESISDPEFAEALDFIENDVDRLKEIAGRYGEMGKRPRMETGPVNPVILNTVHYLSGRVGFVPEGVDIQLELTSRLSVDRNPVLIGWVIENLLKNSLASLAGTETGVIRIASRDIEESDGLVELEVADNGRGIPFRDQKKVFGAGFTTRRGGWGLGLTLCRRIIEEYHGGRIHLAASSPGKGTTFIIQLPASGRDQ